MDSPELVTAMMREVERQAALSRRAEEARPQKVEQPRQNLFTRSIQRLPIPSITPASVS